MIRWIACCVVASAVAWPTCAMAVDDLLPKHITPQAQIAIKAGLDYLAKTQNDEGGWSHAQDGQQYPVSMAALAGMAFLANGNTTTRGQYADNVKKTVGYILRNANASGLICAPVEFNG